MKKIILCFLLYYSATAKHIAVTFQEAEKRGLTVEKLDRKYHNALDSDPAKAVFTGKKKDAFYQAYVKMLTDLSIYLKENHFTWGKPTRIVHRIYFENDGSISYYLVNLKPAGMVEEKEKQFLSILNQFIQHYKIHITGASSFAQCGPAIYMDNKQ
ncbi:MAG: hypothetical protein EOP43_03055 [Sphingobacteriaceae bacterium]|nr:MAG: hypothetical protein EOP43_03055 [Sphingobacteriaceae bacterium]